MNILKNILLGLLLLFTFLSCSYSKELSSSVTYLCKCFPLSVIPFFKDRAALFRDSFVSISRPSSLVKMFFEKTIFFCVLLKG